MRLGTAGAVVGSLVAAAAFGTVERLLSLQHSSFPVAVGGMTAPWLLLPFLVGTVRPRREGTALLGSPVSGWQSAPARPEPRPEATSAVI